MNITRALDILKGWQTLAYHNDDGADEDSHELYWALAIVFRHINRQKAKIERLEELLKGWKTEAYKVADEKDELYCNAVERVKAAKAEAIKEFAERLKNELSFGRYIQPDQIDNLVKEMEREKE